MCAATTPKIKDVTDFKFKQLRDLRIANQQQFETFYPGDRFGDLLAVSNRYGIIFVGTPKGVQAISTADLESVNDDEKKLRVIVEDYRRKDVILTSNILHISLNCDDSILAVCNFRNGFIFADMFDVHSLSRNEFPLSSFSEVKLSSDSSIKLVDFRWNPETTGIFATCLTDKTISIYELGDSSLKILGSNAANASAICWSPKGKQLVVGKFDGTLTQHLPNLQIARVIPAPNIFQNAPTVANIVWSSSFQFVVMYNVANNPSVVIVNAPKTGLPTFINFEDICYSSVDQKPLHYYMSFLTEWGVLLCSSSSAVDIGVLALANNEWEQWNMEDSGRAELPLINNDYTFPLGMSVNITSRRNIPINDTDTVPPKPILHLLVSGGILRSYYIFNLKLDAKQFMKIPEQLPESKRIFPAKALPSPTAPILLNTLKENQTPKPVDVQPRMPTNLFSNNVQNNAPGMPMGISTGSASFLQPKALFTTASVSKSDSNFNLGPKASTINAVNITTSKFDDNLHPQIPSQVMKPTVSALTPSFIPNVKVQSSVKQHFQPSNVSETDKKNKTNTSSPGSKPVGSTALLKVFVEEVSKFNNEIAQVRAKVGKSISIIGSDEERMTLISKTKKLETFLKSAKDATRSLNVDIHTLNGCILDSFATIEEARMMNERSKDPFYLNLHRSRPLDTMRSKKLREIRELYHYLQNQIQEVNALLDWQWMELDAMETKHIKSILHKPSVELVCQTLTTNKRVINNLQLQIQRLSGEADKHRAQLIGSIGINRNDDLGKRGHNSTTNRGLSFQDLAKLSNAMENVDLGKGGNEESYAQIKENPPSHFKLLRNALEKRQVAKVTVSQTDDDFSRFLSPTAKLRNRFRQLSPVDSEQSEPELNEPQIHEEKSLPIISKAEYVIKPTAELPKYSSTTTFPATSSKPMPSNSMPNFSVGQFTAVPTSKKPEILNFDNKLATTGMTSMLQPSFVSSMKPKGTTAPIFSSMLQPNLTIGDNKAFAFSKTPEFSFNLSSGATSTPAKSEPASVFKSVKNDGKLDLKTTESNLNPNYEDISPADSPIKLLQVEDISHESDDHEDYDDDDDDYYDENEIDEYDVEDGEQASDREGSDGDPVILYKNEASPPMIKEIQEAKSEKEFVITPTPALNLSLKPIHSPSSPEDLSVVSVPSPPKSTFSFNSGLPSVFGQPNSPSFSVSSPTPSLPLVSTAAQSTPTATTTAAATASAASPSTFSFATPPKSSPETAAPTVTHSFVMPTFGNVTSPSSTSSFFGKFASTTVASSSTSPNIVSLSSTSIFGVAQKTTTTSFGTTQPAFEGNKSTFEQSTLGSPPSFFASPSKSAFGGAMSSPLAVTNKPEELPKTPSPSGFGQISTVFQTPPQAQTSPPFGQPTTPSTGGGLFNQQITSGFFSGLGGKPSAESANKNIFGGSNFGSAGNTSNLFGNKSPSSFQSSPGAGSGSFSGGSGSVGQSGFGGFQSASIRPGGFGGSPQFGSAPTFGSASPTSTFGSAGVFGARPPQSTNFGSSFTNANDLPTFGSLASQNSAPSFTSVMQQPSSPFGSSNPPSFGTLSNSNSGNNVAPNPPSFGSVSNAGNTSAFNSPFGGNTGFSSQSTSNFSQWRS